MIDKMDGFKARARTMAEGLEPELSAVIDVMYPMAALTKAVGFFKQTYPRTPLLLYVEALGAVVQAVLDGRCRIACTVGESPPYYDPLLVASCNPIAHVNAAEPAKTEV